MKCFPGILVTIIFAVMPCMAGAQMDHEKMMESQGMPGSGANECFKHSMEQAIELQQMHLKNSSRRSEQSDKEMMEQMEHARMCLHEAGVPGGNKGSRDKQMQCADEWLDKAITLHRSHITDPSTRTATSQKQLLKQMRRSYSCTGPSRGTSGQSRGN